MRALLLCLLVMAMSINLYAQEEETSEERDLLGRMHNVRLALLRSSTTIEKADASLLDADLAYRYNFGYVEPGVSLRFRSWEADPGFPGEDVSYSLSVRGNIVKNEAGKNFIPYVEAGMNFIANEDEDATAYTTFSGQPLSFGVGAQFYPFGEIFAFDLAILHSTGEFESTSETDTTDTSADVDSSTTTFRVGYTLSFE